MKSVTFGQLWAVLGLVLFSSTLQVNAKEYYKWVDAKGVTTYSATPQPVQRQEPQLDPVKKNANTTVAQQANVQTVTTLKEPKITTVTATAATTSTKPVTATTAATSNLSATSDMLIPVKNCNGVRCWDMKGKSYNLVAGTTYLSANGGKCQKLGNNMRCSK
ncbi:hypothetical protein GCM10025882_24710 [Acinetobacter gyllenbergii]|uniref:DUF4124 domain-containing protein n=1 Tax=Acinetobacter gyllenbergii CIP 110306 = MTCC 11365 TaxID=1217657 RepID=A0A829HGR4_9GAMM|nr:DUF4124 domain-containing protein [Acinetobacter gyllenbergii]EPF83403.1 hypothetical protein F957_01749 [Acinetobacter gyllenbergii CIP 110306 = MTCC 11365]EPH35479.1 hypothetical protein L293_0070 [Acinetobacter gyllenbergii CIP 110306 = MTCC 11365]ESK57773.1 hypothetical protein F987_00071 [Acinetobacter gyllenbergii NIPH 230]GMA12046.1 hypothetical protein GCM10025882_24710 [Acinetobacter gyllenbergii]